MGFNLADILADVSDPDTQHEQIQYIPLFLIDGDDNNFYQLSGVEDLAANIATVGLQQPIRIRPHPEQPSRYLVVSGHRRLAALELLERDDPEKWAEAPCIVEAGNVSPALQQLRLIYANANTRVLTSAEVGEQAAQVEKLLYQLKEDGFEFPGRMRDHVAQAVGASKTKLARLKVIREKLSDDWMPLFKANKIGESVAYALAGGDSYWQYLIFTVWGDKPNLLYESSVTEYYKRFNRIHKYRCRTGRECQYKTQIMLKSCKDRWTDPCTGCCISCPSLISCKSCCPEAAKRKAELKAAAATKTAEQKRRAAEQEAPRVERIRNICSNIGHAMEAADVPADQLCEAIYGAHCADSIVRRELKQIENPDSVDTVSPILGRIYLQDIDALTRVADLLDVSLDWLLDRDGYPAKPKKAGESDG